MNPTSQSASIPDQATPATVLVVGGSRGIGRGIALAHALRGDTVVVVARTAEVLEAFEKESAAQGLSITTQTADITEPGSAQRVVDAVVDRHGRVDAAVYAPATTRRRPSLDVPASDFVEGLYLNLTSAFLTAQAAARHMAHRGGGSILTIGSVNGMRGIAATSMYSAAKGALVSMSRSLAVEWAPLGIRVNVIIPGFIETESPGKAFRDPELRSWMLERIPMGAFGAPGDIATAATFLASPDARYITGQVLAIDGGVTA